MHPLRMLHSCQAANGLFEKSPTLQAAGVTTLVIHIGRTHCGLILCESYVGSVENNTLSLKKSLQPFLLVWLVGSLVLGSLVNPAADSVANGCRQLLPEIALCHNK